MRSPAGVLDERGWTRDFLFVRPICLQMLVFGLLFESILGTFWGFCRTPPPDTFGIVDDGRWTADDEP